MKVLVTGATGFIGSALLAELAAHNYTAIPVVRHSAGLANEVCIPDINAATDWKNALSGCDAVVHLAALTTASGKTVAEQLKAYRQLNTEGTLHLARQAAECKVKRFVFLSTVKVMGEGGDRSYRETDAPAPVGPYATSKWQAEQGLQQIAAETGLEAVTIRPPLVYGPGVKGNFAALLHLVCSELPLPLGAVDNRRSLVACKNLVNFIALCADHERSPMAANQAFLVSDRQDVSTPELLRKIALAFGKKSRLVAVQPSWLRMAARLLGKSAAAERILGSLTVDSTKALQLLGWSQVVTMDEQLRKMAAGGDAR